MNISRRGFIGALIAAAAAPAIIRTPGLLMPIKPFGDASNLWGNPQGMLDINMPIEIDRVVSGYEEYILSGVDQYGNRIREIIRIPGGGSGVSLMSFRSLDTCINAASTLDDINFTVGT